MPYLPEVDNKMKLFYKKSTAQGNWKKDPDISKNIPK